MKLHSLTRLAALGCSVVALAGCATLEGADPRYPLVVTTAVDGSQAGQLASAIKREALATHAFRSVADNGPGVVTVSVDSIRPTTLRTGGEGFTYLVTWNRDGQQIGRQEDDCATGAADVCGKAVADTMFSHVFYAKR